MENKKEFAFDIETIQNIDLVDTLPEPEVKLGNIKNPKLIKEKIESAKKKQIENMALSAYYGRICSYAIFGKGVTNQYHVIEEITDAEEIKLIKEIFEYFKMTNNSFPQIITWNGYNFDIWFLYLRAMLLNVDLPNGVLAYSQINKRYQTEPHLDIMQVLANWNGYLKLNEVAKHLFDEAKIEIDYTKFVEMIESSQGDTIGIYNLKDAELTYNIYKKMKTYFL